MRWFLYKHCSGNFLLTGYRCSLQTLVILHLCNNARFYCPISHPTITTVSGVGTIFFWEEVRFIYICVYINSIIITYIQIILHKHKIRYLTNLFFKHLICFFYARRSVTIFNKNFVKSKSSNVHIQFVLVGITSHQFAKQSSDTYFELCC